MKSIKRFFMALTAMLAIAGTASAQFHWGPRVGVEVNKLKLNKDMLSSDNRAGFTAGLQVEFTVPIVNLGFDASVMYVHRTANENFPIQQTATTTINRPGKTGGDYVEIPVNFKYKLGLPAIGHIITPYVFTGPSFAFLASKAEINEAWKNKKVDIAWNFGLGIQLINHLQIGASYGLGLTKAVEAVSNYTGAPIDGKNKYWTVSAAWLF